MDIPLAPITCCLCGLAGICTANLPCQSIFILWHDASNPLQGQSSTFQFPCWRTRPTQRQTQGGEWWEQRLLTGGKTAALSHVTEAHRTRNRWGGRGRGGSHHNNGRGARRLQGDKTKLYTKQNITQEKSESSFKKRDKVFGRTKTNSCILTRKIPVQENSLVHHTPPQHAVIIPWS